jgi:uncharacterized repeat protein (TIGR03803 family)
MVFRLNKDGSGYTVLHAFADSPGGGLYPSAELVEGSDGALYGTTREGGRESNAGTVFKIHKDGSGHQVLHSFAGGDGRLPVAPVVATSAGTLFGSRNKVAPITPLCCLS